MAGKPAYTVTGAKETQRAFRRMAADLDDPETSRQAAALIADRALVLVPRVSGALADTVHVESIEGGAAVVAGSDLVPYAGVIEHGWDARGIEGRHYLDRATQERHNDVVDLYARHVGGLVERVGRES